MLTLPTQCLPQALIDQGTQVTKTYESWLFSIKFVVCFDLVESVLSLRESFELRIKITHLVVYKQNLQFFEKKIKVCSFGIG